MLCGIVLNRVHHGEIVSIQMPPLLFRQAVQVLENNAGEFFRLEREERSRIRNKLRQ